MRNISFSLTEEQFINGTKDVTRRTGWEFLKPGDRLRAVRKAMGLKKGEKVHALGVIEVVSVRREMLMDITQSDITREGFQAVPRRTFIEFFLNSHPQLVGPSSYVTRIEFRKVS